MFPLNLFQPKKAMNGTLFSWPENFALIFPGFYLKPKTIQSNKLRDHRVMSRFYIIQFHSIEFNGARAFSYIEQFA